MVTREERAKAARGGGVESPEGFLFELTGGHMALDLANTLDLRPSPTPRELLRDYDALVRWSEQAGVVEASAGRALRALAVRRPRQASAALRHARQLREALFALFSAAARGAALPREPLATLDSAVASASSRLRLQAEGRRAVWRWSAEVSLESMLWPVARAAADLLVSPELHRVRSCESESCDWLFLDLSRNRTRRWCDMAVCGNRSKVRRFREARRRSRSAPTLQLSIPVAEARDGPRQSKRADPPRGRPSKNR
jgi:predicted RNA-binding Zn ribbon-like protein